MKLIKKHNLSIEEYINLSLYDKKFGYYSKKKTFGKKGDFLTAPNISRLFSEMIAIWSISFWESLGSPRKFNLIELGPGRGSLMMDIVRVLDNFLDKNIVNYSLYFHEINKFYINTMVYETTYFIIIIYNNV